jgi:hypothetical protein
VAWTDAKKRIDKNRQKFLEYKKTLQCEACGLSDYRILEFHHVEEKDSNISDMVCRGYAWNRIEKEIEKCIPLCCNCHRLEHWELNALETCTP